MAILSKMDRDGGFTVGDTNTGMTGYAYPTSTHAVAARRKPERVRDEMARRMSSAPWPEYHQRNWTRLLAIDNG